MARKRVARKRSTSAKKAAEKATKKGSAGAAKKPRKPARKAARKGAAKRSAAKKATPASAPLTLTEVSKRTGISMPTLQRYKKEYQKRLQTVGKGRTQRYKVESLETFKKIKEENLKKRGRPRKSAPAAAAKAAPRAAAAPEGLISLSEIGRRTGISYPTLLRYVRLHGDRIPSHGTGRKRRFPVEAVPIFSQLRKESRRGRRKGAPAKKAAAAGGGLDARVRQLEKSHAALEKRMKKLLKALRQPLVKGV